MHCHVRNDFFRDLILNSSKVTNQIRFKGLLSNNAIVRV